MAEVPAASPLTFPLTLPTVATSVLLLLQAPPVVWSLSAVVAPEHTDSVPSIGGGSAFTVTVVRAVQPVAAAV